MLNRYYIVDLDGTLYFQTPVRLIMISELLLYYVFHLSRLKDLKIISQYRKNHEKNIDDFDVLAQQCKTDTQYAKSVIEKWMIKRPLKWIKIFADRKLLKILKNKNVIVYSDYPTDEKLRALNFMPMAQYFCDGVFIKHYKPNSQGLEFISRKYNLLKDDMVIIGDRMSHDGVCAQKFGSEYLILRKTFIGRLFQYRKIK